MGQPVLEEGALAKPTAVADLSFFDGVPLLNMIASALVDMSRRQTAGDPVYADKVQSAYNHLVLRSLKRGDKPPGSVVDMVRWARERPLGDWPLDLPAELGASDKFLVDKDTRTPTQACLEWTVPARDAAAEQFENLLMEEALEICRAAHAPESYTAFRKLLISRPVLTGTEISLFAGDIDLSLLHEVIKRSYEPAPASYLHEDAFIGCKRCKCLLVPTKTGFKCELDRCRRDGHAEIGERYDPQLAGGIRQLTRPLRMFITGPGLAEVDLEAELAKKPLSLVAEMWPNFDAYDLRISFPDNQVWAIDVKDRVDPMLLGKSAKPFRAEPRFDKAFLVVPQYRFADREDYLRTFNRHRPPELKDRLELVTDTELLRRAKGTLRRIRQTLGKEDGDA